MKPKHLIPELTSSQLQKFLSLIEKTSTCWNWKGTIHKSGYGNMGINGHELLVHRIAYRVFRKGRLIRAYVLDHLCRNKRCVNPLHLRQVTERTNTLAGTGFSARNARKTSCKHGHPLKGENLGTQWGGKYRRCLTCDKESKHQSYQRLCLQPTFKEQRSAYQKQYLSNPKNWQKRLAWQRIYRRKQLCSTKLSC